MACDLRACVFFPGYIKGPQLTYMPACRKQRRIHGLKSGGQHSWQARAYIRQSPQSPNVKPQRRLPLPLVRDQGFAHSGDQGQSPGWGLGGQGQSPVNGDEISSIQTLMLP
jgi:hypothetical protein